jgi:GTPase SAR1 family protein
VLDTAIADVVDRTAAAARRAGEHTAADALRAEADRGRSDHCWLVFVGETNRGKSTLINALVEHENLLPVDADVASAVHVQVRGGPELTATVFDSENPAGRPVDPADLYQHAAVDPATGRAYRQGVYRVEVTVTAAFLVETGLRLVDTPGVGGLVKGHADLALATVELADALIFVVNASSELTRSELDFLRRATERVTTVLFVLTQIDLYPGWQSVLIRNQALIAEHAPKYRDAPWLPVSSRYRLDANRTGDEKLAARRRERSGFDALIAACSMITDRTTRIRSANIAQFAATIAGRLCQHQMDQLRSLALDPDLPALVAEQRRLVDGAAAVNAEWRATLAQRLNAIKSQLDRRFANSIRALHHGASRAISEGGANVLDSLAQDLPARAEAIWLDLKAELGRQVDALGNELATLLGADLSMPRETVTAAAVDISIPDPIRTRALAPTVVEHGLGATGLGVAVGALVGTITLNPAAGWAAFVGTVGVLTGLRSRRDRVTTTRGDATRFLNDLVTRIREEVPAEIMQVLSSVKQNLETTVDRELSTERARLNDVLAQHQANLDSQQDDLDRRKSVADRQLTSYAELREQATQLATTLGSIR